LEEENGFVEIRPMKPLHAPVSKSAASPQQVRSKSAVT
jgi:hypothetical protein